MSIRNFCGFEAGDFTEAISTGTSGTGSIAIESGSPMQGDYSLKSSGSSSDTAYAAIPARNDQGVRLSINSATAYYVFKFKPTTLPSSEATGEEFVRIVDTSQNLKMALRLFNNGVIKAYDSTDTLMATGSTTLSAGSTYEIGIECGTGASAAWDVEIDGVSEISGSADNLRTSNCAYLVLGKAVNNDNQTWAWEYDDVVMDDGSMPATGNTVRRMDVTGAGTYTDFAAGSGAGDYQDLDEVPHDELTTYLIGQSINDRESTTHESTSSAGVSSTIVATICGFVVKRDGASNGSCRIHRRVNSTDYETTTNQNTLSTWKEFGLVDTVSPDTSVAWTTAELDALELGMLNRSNNDSDLTQTRLFVLFTPSSGDPEGPLIGGKLVGGGILMQGRLVG